MLRLAGLLLASLFLAAQPSRAIVIDLTADIRGENEVPPTDSLAFGTGVFEYDDEANELTFTILYTSALFDTDEVGAHIHGPAGPGENADILFDLDPGELKQGMVNLSAIDACSGDVEGCEDDLLAGLWYVNIHSSEHTDGEIRGQILAVPEPAAALSLALAAGAGVLLMRRRAA